MAGARIRQPEGAHLALGHELADRASDVLDGNVWVDPVLVEQVERVDA